MPGTRRPPETRDNVLTVSIRRGAATRIAGPGEVDPTAITRDLAIDRLRGLLLILMVGGDYLGGLQITPTALEHAPDLGFTIADTVAPAFIFLIGVNYGPSFARWRELGRSVAYQHFLTRYLVLMGIGAIISGGTSIVTGVPTDWGVLQAIGIAGLICLPTVRAPTWARFVIGIVLLFGYQLVLNGYMLPYVRSSIQGGLFGGISWGALLILATAIADVWRKGLAPYAVCCAILASAAGMSLLFVPVSKHRVSLSFVLITLAISAVAFLLFELGARLVPAREGFFCWWGQNSLMMYLIHLLLLGVMVLPAVTWWYSKASGWQVSAQLILILGVMSVIAWWTHRRRLRLEL